MTCAGTKKQNNPDWLPSMSVAGSILLQQRNPHMNGCAAVLGILLKSNSLEGTLDCFHDKTSPIFNPEMFNNNLFINFGCKIKTLVINIFIAISV